jgi:hypothetical protein
MGLVLSEQFKGCEKTGREDVCPREIKCESFVVLQTLVIKVISNKKSLLIK